MSSFIELDKELDGFDNTCIDLSLSYCIFINMIHIDTKNLNTTNNSVNELIFSNFSQKKLNTKPLVQLILIMFAVYLPYIKIEAVYDV